MKDTKRAAGAMALRPPFAAAVVLVAAALLIGLAGGGCAALLEQPPPDYAFGHPLFNEPYATSAAVAAAPDPAPAAPAEPAPRRDERAMALPAPPPEQPPAALHGAGPSATTGAGKADVAGAPAIGAPPSGEHADRRVETLEAARRLLGMRDAFDARGFLHHLLSVGDVHLSGLATKPSIRDVYRSLRGQELTYDRSAPEPGDLVFFHNTEDTNGDGRQNDWYSLVGVVESVDSDGTVTLILPVEGEVARRSMNLGRPEVRRLEASGAVLNDVLRQKRLDDPAYTQYLAGELYAGFAALPD